MPSRTFLALFLGFWGWDSDRDSRYNMIAV